MIGMVRDHRLIDERSLAFDRLTAAKLAEDPSLIDRARSNIDRWLASPCPAARAAWLEWREILDGPVDSVRAVLLADDARARRLRQSSPFAGILSRAERSAILKEFQNRESMPA
jgi:hypothetical protein